MVHQLLEHEISFNHVFAQLFPFSDRTWEDCVSHRLDSQVIANVNQQNNLLHLLHDSVKNFTEYRRVFEGRKLFHGGNIGVDHVVD